MSENHGTTFPGRPVCATGWMMSVVFCIFAM